ncbi:MAG: adenylate/guanylate cyclase domain-containing protein [Myxococcaceae bacterium]
MANQPVSLSAEIEFATAPANIWQLIADTNRLNHFSGNPALRVSPLSDDRAERFRIQSRAGFIELDFDEAPYEWRQGERFSVLRTLRSGPVRSLRNVFRLLPLPGGGTRLSITVQILPRYFLGRLAAHTVGRVILGRVRRALERQGRRLLQSGASAVGEASSSVLAGPYERAAQALRERVSPDPHALAERVLELVRSGPDSFLGRLRPKALASDWDVASDALVPVFLHAVLSGLLELKWELICPSCRTGTEGYAALADVPDQGHCQFCDLVFGVDLDSAVEAVFRPQPAVRPVAEGPWCIGGPARTPHVIEQVIVAPDSNVQFTVPAQAGRYRLFGRGGAVAQVEVEPGNAPAVDVRFEPTRFDPPALRVSPGGVIRLAHPAPLHRHVKLEHVTWADHALSARELGFHPEFRRYFGRGLLRPGQLLTVSRMCVLFSDLTGSTELYSRVGDATAFQFVQDHFEYVASIVQRRRGTIIKTIGDAVMAGFEDDAQALSAAVELQRGWDAFLTGFPSASACRLKIGLFGGPCYAVSANGQLDLFGQSVNIAARLQSSAGAGEIIAPASIVEAVEQNAFAPLVAADRFVPELKGVTAAPAVVRLKAS